MSTFQFKNGKIIMDGKILTKEEILENQFNYINKLIEIVSNSEDLSKSSEAAGELLFQAAHDLDKSNKIGKLLQKYIKECLYNALFKPISNSLATKELFCNMDTEDAKSRLFKAFNLNRKSQKRKLTYRDGQIIKDFIILEKKTNKAIKKEMIKRCLCFKYGLKKSQIAEILKKTKIKEQVLEEIAVYKKRFINKPDFNKNQLSLQRLLIIDLKKIADEKSLESLFLPKIKFTLSVQIEKKAIQKFSEIYTLISCKSKILDWEKIFDIAFTLSHEISSTKPNSEYEMKLLKELVNFSMDIARQAASISLFDI